uniref:tRNA (adenosine(37)-N6)-dimethylallyltransferase MiaA n=1 Tax=Ningiella ruwaisensis TaxID=2364274 RepID=UPI00109F62C0|nr:tRNA (adenosine(37)-N6)-dimethylallyltransferase MiaA [Ningiella ruwaisensis]
MNPHSSQHNQGASSATHAHPKVVCIMGPTASGKTALAIELAKQIDGEVISVDSALIYKDMDIGTAKPDADEMQGIEHHLIDILTPDLPYSVADFYKDAVECIEKIHNKGKTPILAGGTMMYFNALHHGISDIPGSNYEVRQNVQQMIENEGLEQVHSKLAQVDPQSAARIHPNDPQRITRAMEVYLSTGKSLTSWQNQKRPSLPYQFINVALMTENRAYLHQRIALRFQQMVEKGLISEVKHILKTYKVNPDLPSMRSVGYRQVIQHLAGEFDESLMIERGIIATRQLAKRQITWLRGWENTQILDIESTNNLELLLQKICVTE